MISAVSVLLVLVLCMSLCKALRQRNTQKFAPSTDMEIQDVGTDSTKSIGEDNKANVTHEYDSRVPVSEEANSMRRMRELLNYMMCIEPDKKRWQSLIENHC